MKALKSFLVWILLIALPIQGFAAVSMSMCEPGKAALAAKAQAGHSEASSSAMPDCEHHRAAAPPADTPGDCDGSPDTGKCSACAACSVGVSIAASFASFPQFNTHSAGPIPYVAAYATACTYGALERPPHSLA
jgi:hypothetical protein